MVCNVQYYIDIEHYCVLYPLYWQSEVIIKHCLVDLGYFFFIQFDIECVHDVQILGGADAAVSRPGPALLDNLEMGNFGKIIQFIGPLFIYFIPCRFLLAVWTPSCF